VEFPENERDGDVENPEHPIIVELSGREFPALAGEDVNPGVISGHGSEF